MIEPAASQITPTPLALFQGIGPLEIAIVLAVLLLVFGAKVPDVMRSLGRGLAQFRRGVREFEDEMKSATDSAPRASAPASEPRAGAALGEEVAAHRPREEPHPGVGAAGERVKDAEGQAPGAGKSRPDIDVPASVRAGADSSPEAAAPKGGGDGGEAAEKDRPSAEEGRELAG
jgi:TatA/E family protein of Tat protein translocase